MSDSHGSDIQKPDTDPVAYNLDQRRRAALSEVDNAGFRYPPPPPHIHIYIHSLFSQPIPH